MSKENKAEKLEDSMSLLFNSLFCQKACQQTEQPPKPSSDQTASFMRFLDSIFGKQVTKDSKERLRGFIRMIGVDTIFDLTVMRLCQLFDNSTDAGLQIQFVKAFLKHQKWHETQAARCMQALKEKPKFTAKIKEALKEHVACLPSNLCLLQCLQTSKALIKTAKSLELINKLLAHVAPLFELDADPLVQIERQEMNLNKLILMHGQMAAPMPRITNEIVSTLDGEIVSSVRQLDSAKSPDKWGALADASRGRKHFNMRANSEPPTEFINPTQIDEESGIPEESKEISGEFSTKHQQPRLPMKVPPIMVNQLNDAFVQSKNGIRPDNSNSFGNTASSQVLNNFFNIPHGKYNSQQNPAFNSGQTSGPSTQKNSQYKFTNQHTLAHSRLTRRQMTLSRQTSLKPAGSSTNLLRSANPPQTKSFNNRHASQPPLEDKFTETQVLKPYSTSMQDDIASLKDRPISKTPIVPPIALQKITHLPGPISVSPFPQTGATHGVLASTQKSQADRLNNIMLSKLQGRNSQVTKSSQSPTSQRKETDYDEEWVNEQQSAEQKLHTLAVQLGESCLTSDLAFLMSQKRDFELVQSARKSALLKPKGSFKGFEIKRSISLDNGSLNHSLLAMPSLIYESKDEIRNRKKQLRIVLLNAIHCVLAEHSNDEARFIKQPITLFNCYLSSSYFRRKRLKKQLKQFSNAECKTKEQFSIDIHGRTHKTPQTRIDEKEHDSEEILKPSIINSSSRQDQRKNPSQSSESKSVLCQSESYLVSSMLSKFSFVNEEILRTQVTNDLQNFTNRDKIIDTRLMNTLTGYNGYYLHGHYMPQSQLSASPTKNPNRSQHSYDDVETFEHDPRVKPAARPMEAMHMLKNPNFFWTNNGVAYELTTSHNPVGSLLSAKNIGHNFVSPQKIRKKLDVLLYHTSRSIRYVFSKGLDVTSVEFAKAITANIIALSSYFEAQKSRTLIHQFIEVALEPTLMIKKALVDVALRSNLLVMDFSKNVNVAEIIISAKGSDGDQRSLQKQMQAKQHALRQMFSEFLLLISYLLKMPQSSETMKLLNETLIFDEMWQEAIKTFTISLFLCDILTQSMELSSLQQQIFDELRGVNIVNFDETKFFALAATLKDERVITIATTVVKRHLLSALSILKYLKAVTSFFKQVTVIYFAPYSEQETNKPSATLTDQSHLAGGHTGKYRESGMSGTQTKDARKNEDETEFQKQRKYWKHVIRRTLYQLMFLITHPNGLIFQYLQKNAISFQVIGQSREPTTPLNMKLTKPMLGFLRELFMMPNKLTKFVFDEELLLFYIRTHYISLVKLYHKSYKLKRTDSTLHLCKRHVACLLAIACNRTDETRRKLYQFKIVQFLLQEIGLEYELQQRRERFLKLSKEQEVMLSKASKQVEANAGIQEVVSKPLKKPLIPMIKTGGLGLSTLVKENGMTAEEMDVQALVKPVVQETAPKKPIIPSLKTAGLGLSTIVKEGGKTQEEIDVEQQVLQVQPAAKKMPVIPMLKTGGLGLSTLIKDGGKTQEELDVENQIKGKVAVRSARSSATDDSGPNEVSVVVKESKRSTKDNPAKQLNNDGSDSSDPDSPEPEAQKAPPQPKKVIPMLKVQGLGFSNLIKEGGKTQEELDVDSQIKSNQTKPELFKKVDLPVIQDLPEHMKEVLLSISDLKGQSSVLLSEENDRAFQKRTVETDSKKLFPRFGVQASQQIDRKVMSPMNVISGFAGSSMMSSHIIESQQRQLDPMKISEGVLEDAYINMLSPQNQMKLGSIGSDDHVEIQINMLNNPEKNQRYNQTKNTQETIKEVMESKTSFNLEDSTKLSRLIQQDKAHQDIASYQKRLVESKHTLDARDDAPQSAGLPETECVQDLSEEVFYMLERAERPIYQDQDLHVLMLALMLCLLLKPQRGTLDELYCSQFPILNEDQNVLYLLHFHLSHPKNQSIVPKLLKQVQQISPPLAGIRLLKLLCPSLFDLSLYNNGKNWSKLAEGAYGIVYECRTNLSQPKLVAIKQMHLPQSIQDRCVLHDIFTEITCLEEFRLEPCVTDLYDYGVDQTSYYIVMKRYAGSIKEWRVKQKAPLSENLSLYLQIYKEILRCFQIIHSHNVTHYDIKCDNVLIDFAQQSPDQLYTDDFAIAVADFGECYMYTGDRDAYSNKNRGTDAIKSPEMLLLAVNTRKETDKYDRRKREGTNSLSDVWSLGCLLFELLTGQMLFDTEEYIQFHVQLTSVTQTLLIQDKLDLINNNIYLIDFLKYILVRDMRMRPTIQNVIKRFEHVHALLVSTSSTNQRHGRLFSPGSLSNFQSISKLSLTAILEKATVIMTTGNIKQIVANIGANSESPNDARPEVMRIMEDVFFSNAAWVVSNPGRAVRLGITHLIIKASSVSSILRDQYVIFEVNQEATNPFMLMPAVMDFMRKAALFKGRILFVEDQACVTTECMVMCLASIYQTNAYETYTLIKSQNLFFQVDSNRLVTISKWAKLCSQITHYLASYPRFSCICGSCVFVLKRKFANYSGMHTVKCHCTGYYKNLEGSQCPSTGCQDYIAFLKTYFKDKVSTLLPDDQLHWGYLDEDDFIVGPNLSGLKHHQRMLASNISQTTDQNSVLVGVTEKSLISSVTPNADLISRSSATRRQGSYQYGGTKWKLFKCKECQVWTHALTDSDNNKFAILLNNRVKERKLSCLGLLANEESDQTVRVPILHRIKLRMPF